MRSILFLLLIVALRGSAHAQILRYPDKAFELAQTSGKKVMLVFSGSDWCIPCIRFNKQILSDSSFLSFAGENLVLLEADFPQRKKIAGPLRSQYDSLAAAFNPQGAFPQVVLLSPGKKLVAYVPYREQTPAGFISTLKQLLQ
ncbi:thioredoxin family protein [Chitinophaga sp. CF418]|uniref:thioredoxin family protein n=1 Tax=Chitinophaga sp. CF418 TaxID=1855287 RepID=UPI00091EC668|nr:thioredoxin family protein [Chitinophaga sp. CF418]SHM98958.1 Thioredoxin-like [Chitinophaga sp. CF418]